MEQYIKEMISENKVSVKQEKICLRDAREAGLEGKEYENCYILKASNSVRPTVIDRDRSPLTKEDDKIKAGGYVNAIIDFWLQNNQFGKRINANLKGVQYVKEGEPLGAVKTASSSEFDQVEEIPSDEDVDF